MNIIAKLSFPIKNAFQKSISDAFNQFKRHDYASKLKICITSESLPDHEDLSAYLCDQITYI